LLLQLGQLLVDLANIPGHSPIPEEAPLEDAVALADGVDHLQVPVATESPRRPEVALELLRRSDLLAPHEVVVDRNSAFFAAT